MAKKVFTDQSFATLIDETKSYVDNAVSKKANSSHTHSISDVTNLQTTLDTKAAQSSLTSHTNNSTIHVTSDNKTQWNSAYSHSTSSHAPSNAERNIIVGIQKNGSDLTVNSSTRKVNITVPTTAADIDAASSTHNHDDKYDAKGAADTALSSAKTYADTAASNAATKVKNDLLNGAGTAYDTLKELGDLIVDNADAIDALETIASGKADATHSHAISEVSGLQSALDGKADYSHGTHVSYSTTAPVMDGTASVGSASTVARSDHKHPTDTSRASKTEFDGHVADTTKHITSTERTNWGTAYTHSQAAHAPSNAEKNQNAFSNIAVNGQTTVAADTTTDTVTFAGSNVSITTNATSDTVTFSVADGSTSSKGIVQLTNSTSSTSTTTAATPSSVKSAYDLANTAKTNAATAQTRADSAYSLAEGKVDSLSDLGITATATELNYLDGVTSNIQTQLDSKKSLRTTRLTVGTSASGWTSSDCDYLCDGTADQVEINAAIAALPTNGGEIVILDGTYNVSAAIVLSGIHITLKGNNGATNIVRAFKGTSSAMGVIVVTGNYCTVQGLTIDGVKSTYTGYYHSGIYVSGGHNNFIENETMNNETSGIYISTAFASYNMIHRNKSHNNNGYGIYNNSTNVCNTFSDNTCESNSTIGLYVGNNGKNTVTGNICITNGTHGIGLYTENSAVSGNVCNENTKSGLYSSSGKYNGIAGNTFNANGEYGIQLGSNTSGNSLVGNTCANNVSGDINDAGNNEKSVFIVTDDGEGNVTLSFI